MLVLFGAALASFAVWQFWEIRAQVEIMALQSKAAIRAGEIGAELETARRSLLRYAFDQAELKTKRDAFGNATKQTQVRAA